MRLSLHCTDEENIHVMPYLRSTYSVRLSLHCTDEENIHAVINATS